MRQSAGFTLIEVVVSLAILALSLGVIYESFGWALRSTARLERRETAWLTAQSLLGELRNDQRMQIGEQAGELSTGLRWTRQITPRESGVDPASVLQPFDATIEVAWGERSAQRVRLQSIELGRMDR